MNRFNQQLMVMLLVVLVLSSLYSCVHQEPADVSNNETVILEIQITGQTTGKLKMMLSREEIQKDIYSVTGRFSGRIIDHVGGPGQLECKFEGKIEKNSIFGSFTGYAST